MKPVTFREYLRPNGRQEQVVVDRPDEIAEKAKAIWDAGYRLECEVLRSGDVHLTLSDDDEDIEGIISKNGPEVLDAVDQLITGFKI